MFIKHKCRFIRLGTKAIFAFGITVHANVITATKLQSSHALNYVLAISKAVLFQAVIILSPQ